MKCQSSKEFSAKTVAIKTVTSEVAADRQWRPEIVRSERSLTSYLSGESKSADNVIQIQVADTFFELSAGNDALNMTQ